MKHVYTLDDLRDPAFLETHPHTKLAVIGCPIHHSASPQMHQAALDIAKIPLQYIRLEVQPGKVADAFTLMESLGFIGCNVTVPHKLEAMDLCDSLTDDAVALGATNTIRFKNSEKQQDRRGHNTDGPGLEQAILDDFGKSLSDLRILILGAGGGAGRAIATQCARSGSPEIYLSNRTVGKLTPIADSLRHTHGAQTVHILSNAPADLTAAAEKVDLIINSTSLGLKATDLLPLPLNALRADILIYDAIYNPPLTPLLKAANEQGATTSNGLSMLLHQGAIAFEFWLHQRPDISAMRSALL